MFPTQATFIDMLNKLAASAATLAKMAGSENVIALITNNFAPARGLVVGDLTLAAFTGSTPLEVTAGTQQVGRDSLANLWFIELIPPVGGWYWECSVAPVAPVQVYGFALLDSTLAALYGAQLLPAPVTIAAVSDTVATGPLRFYENELA